jgi:hypothetical protein
VWKTTGNENPVFRVSSTTSGDLVTVTNAGNVGIGTTGPLDKLDVRGNIILGYNSNQYLKLYRGDANQIAQIWTDSAGLKIQNLDSGGSTPGIHLVAPSSRSNVTDVFIQGNTGNVGIGTTGPNTKLETAGTIRASYSTNPNIYTEMLYHASKGPLIDTGGGGGQLRLAVDGTDVMFLKSTGRVGIGGDPGTAGLYISGNVGIGTTNPSQKLHVEGQCLTGDTLLAIRRRRKHKNIKTLKHKNTSDEPENEDDNFEYEYLLVPIREVFPGDEVLSLNEATNRVKYAKIKALMDMGVREIYELRTKSGRVIRTTANHPYLVKSQITNSKSQNKS